MNILKAIDFYQLRTPLLPYSTALNLFSLQGNELEEKIKSILSDPCIKEAILISSPSLHKEISGFVNSREADQKLLLSFFKYIVRMSYRCTPFGTFAGVSVGQITDRTSILLNQLNKNRRCARLDFDFVWSLSQKIVADTRLREELIFYPNNTLTVMGQRLCFIAYSLDKASRKFQSLSVEDSAHIQAILQVCENGANIPQLVASLLKFTVLEEEAMEFIHELINSQILHSSIEPGVTGEEYMDKLDRSIAKSKPLESVYESLTCARKVIDEINAEPVGSLTQKYDELSSVLNPLGLDYKMSLPFQVDMVTATVENKLNKEVLEEVKNCIDFLAKYKPPVQNSKIENFKKVFKDRYGNREMPLLEILDAEIGIGYPVSEDRNSFESTILQGITFDTETKESINLTNWEIDAFYKYAQGINQEVKEVQLSDKDILGKPERLLPNSMYASFTVISKSAEDVDNGNFKICFKGAGGPSGANNLARFCSSDSVLSEHVKQMIHFEEDCEPDVILAEIVHVSSEGVGNVVQRPAFRKYEIPILAKPSVSSEHTILLSDLMVSVKDGKIFMRSKKLNKQVKPRLTNAHDYTNESLPHYHFLCDLHYTDSILGLYWNWGPLLASLEFLPRVTYGKVILSRARWSISAKNLNFNLTNSSPEQWKNFMEDYCDRKKIPASVLLTMGDDNELALDLRNDLCMKIVFDKLKKEGFVFLVECLFNENNCFVSNGESMYTNEFLGLFENDSFKSSLQPQLMTKETTSIACHTNFTPSSEWTYVKLYCNYKSADYILTTCIAELVDSLIINNTIDKWFYIRYNDPEFHIRLRFHRVNGNCSDIMQRLEQLVSTMLNENRIWKIQYDTYEPEYHRYGYNNMSNSECIFYHDSNAAVEMLNLLNGGETGQYYRPLFAMRAVDSFLTDWGLSLIAKREWMSQMSKAYSNQYGATAQTQKQLSEKYREYRIVMNSIIDEESDPAFKPVYEILRKRSELIRTTVTDILILEEKDEVSTSVGELIGSYVHMFVNRLMSANANLNEVVIYDLLHQHYKSLAARRKNSVFQKA